MKKMLPIVLLFLTAHVYAQVNLEYTFNSTVTAAQVAPGEWNYYNVMGQGNYNSGPYNISVYGLDHSLITSFTTTGINNGDYAETGSATLTKGTFTSDTDEYVWESFNSVGGSSTDYYCDVESSNGTVILTIQNVVTYGSGTIFNTKDGTKFLVPMNSGNTEIYSLPGVASGIPRPQADILVSTNAYPNPATNIIHLLYNLNGGSQGEMDVLNMNGQILKKYTVDNTFSDILFNTAALPKGSYLYYLVVNGVKSQPQQFEVQ